MRTLISGDQFRSRDRLGRSEKEAIGIEWKILLQNLLIQDSKGGELRRNAAVPRLDLMAGPRLLRDRANGPRYYTSGISMAERARSLGLRVPGAQSFPAPHSRPGSKERRAAPSKAYILFVRKNGQYEFQRCVQGQFIVAKGRSRMARARSQHIEE
jgi:hypothetical protein